MAGLFGDDEVRLIISGNKRLVPKTYRFLWAKYVNGFNDNAHCANCLRGKRTEYLGVNAPTNIEFAMDESPNWDFIYLCGVTYAGYEFNLHLPVAYSFGDTASFTDHAGLTFTFHNAREVGIPPLPDGFMGYDRSFTTCRNFQFGWEYYKANPIVSVRDSI